jgi:hypothetical protein
MCQENVVLLKKHYVVWGIDKIGKMWAATFEKSAVFW